jgi:acetyl esterase/lipase
MGAAVASLLAALLLAPGASRADSWAPEGLDSLTIAVPHPRGTVLVIHGGGWLNVGPSTLAFVQPEAARFASYGWRAISVDYRPGLQSLDDALAWYDAARRRFRGPLCLYGQSAGGHLALWVAAHRPVRCVIADGAPADLRMIGGNPQADELRDDYVIPVFGAALWRYSITRVAAHIHARVLLAASAGDAYVGCAQVSVLARVLPSATGHCLPAGPAPFIHAGVTQAAAEREYARERALLNQGRRRCGRGTRTLGRPGIGGSRSRRGRCGARAAGA